MKKNRCTSFSLSDHPDFGVDTFFVERSLAGQGFVKIAGVDEAGRGPLAGPVTAGCVILHPDDETDLYRDSKKLTASRREDLYHELFRSRAFIGIGTASAREIEQINILQASLLAMRRAIEDCLSPDLPDFLLIDGNFSVPLAIPQESLVKGESKSASIAAASIIAKVTRDRFMARAHERFPQYNFLSNQGYPTREHREAIARHGPCELHRRTFKGVREFLDTPKKDKQAVQQSLW